jgi:hypothetical protein
VKWALVALVVAATFGCKKKVDTTARDFRATVCACKDVACAQRAIASFEKRFAEQAKRTSSEATDLMREAQDCIAKVYASDSANQGSAAGSSSAAAPLPPPQATRDADALIAAARTSQKTMNARLAIYIAKIEYVDANGVLDADDGAATITFGAATIGADDSKRKTGAPVKTGPMPASCPVLTNTKGSGWAAEDSFCMEVPADNIPRCTTKQIWKRAIDQKAPADALAVIAFENHQTPPQWIFKITDAPRGVDITHTFPDDCERVLEAPGSAR